MIEQDISDRARDAFTEAGISWAQLVVDGRDLTLVGVAPSAAARSAAYRLAAQLDGVRLVRNRTTLRTGRPPSRSHRPLRHCPWISCCVRTAPG